MPAVKQAVVALFGVFSVSFPKSEDNIKGPKNLFLLMIIHKSYITQHSYNNTVFVDCESSFLMLEIVAGGKALDAFSVHQ